MQAIVIMIYVLLSVSGVVFFKLGSTQELLLEITRSSFSLRISWLSVLGLVCYVISFLVYMGLIAKNDLSYLIPVVTGVVYIMTMLSSAVIFKEAMQMYQVIGSILILLGVILMNLKKG